MALTFKECLLAGIPDDLPSPKSLDDSVPHAPIRPQVLSESEKILAIQNSLRYIPTEWHST